MDKPEVSKQVFYLLSFVERKPAEYLIIDVQFAQRLLHCTRLRIGAVKYGKVGVHQLVLHLLFKDGACHKLPFFVVG